MEFNQAIQIQYISFPIAQDSINLHHFKTIISHSTCSRYVGIEKMCLPNKTILSRAVQPISRSSSGLLVCSYQYQSKGE